MSRIQNTCVLAARRLMQLTVLAAVMSPTAVLADEETENLINPNVTQFSFGLAHSDHDNQRFGMYNGLEEGRGYAIGEFNLVRRYDDTGTWLRVAGSDLGLSTVNVSAELERQGDWRIAIDYDQIPRVTPYEIHTDLQGIGSNDQAYGDLNNSVQPASTARGIDLETNRYKSRLELSRYFGKDIQFKVRFQHENKQGERIFGRGTSSTQEFLAEPIDYQTRQVDASINYTGERLRLSGGYYGSFFNNRNTALNIINGATALDSFTPIALPPDNSAHQFSLSGNYRFTETALGTFKLAHTRAIQDDDFITVTPSSPLLTDRNDLGGRVDTTLVDLGLSAQPIPKLSLIGKLRYEDRDDKTTVDQYITAGNSTDGRNEPRSIKTESGKLEATYRLPHGFSINGGINAERKERNMEGVRVVGYREDVEEITYRINLRRALAEDLNGSVGFSHSNRTGSDFRTLRTWNTNGTANDPSDDFFNPGDAGLYVNGGLLQPIHLADRDRNKLALALDWVPTDALSLQFNLEGSKDDYAAGLRSDRSTDSGVNPHIGAREGKSWLLNVEASYALNANWNLSAWATRNVTSMDQATCTDANPGADCPGSTWTAEMTSRSDAIGLGVRGKAFKKLDLGADVAYMRDHNEYEMAGIGGAAAASDLPTITSYQTTVKLFGSYPIGKESSVQLDYILDHRKTNDWTWTDWRFSDGTELDQHPEETTHFIGVSYRYGFR